MANVTTKAPPRSGTTAAAHLTGKALLATSTAPLPQWVIAVPNPQATNPAKGKRGERWALLLTMNGKTVGDYYAACRSAPCGGCTANNPLSAHGHGLIVLTPPTPAPAAPDA